MLRIDHVVTASPEQLEFVIEGMRNPKNSWKKSDSNYICMADDYDNITLGYEIGKDDYELMQNLSSAGTDHRKYMRMMPVFVTINAPLYWWKEFDTYKVGTVSNSCSTMHTITNKEFTINDFSVEHLSEQSLNLMDEVIDELNLLRNFYINFDKDSEYIPYDDKKDIWWQIIQLLPSSYNQTRNIMMNYEVLANIVKSRQSHKLDEWREFCQWATTLPYAKGIIF